MSPVLVDPNDLAGGPQPAQPRGPVGKGGGGNGWPQVPLWWAILALLAGLVIGGLGF